MVIELVIRKIITTNNHPYSSCCCVVVVVVVVVLLLLLLCWLRSTSMNYNLHSYELKLVNFNDDKSNQNTIVSNFNY
jgi:uncharacterized membrane protein YjgN (DUF898 family)